MNNYGNQFDGPAYVLGTPAYGPVVTLASITDGLSNTAMFSEWVRGKNVSHRRRGLFQIYKASIACDRDDLRPPHHLPEFVQERDHGLFRPEGA